MARIKEFDRNEKLKIARDLFWEKGYQSTSMSDLVQHLKINRSSIYDTFGSKHELFIACLKNYLAEKEQSYKLSAAKGDSPLKSAIFILKDILNSILLDTKTCLSINSTFELSRIDEEARKLLSEHALQSVHLFEQLFTEAKKVGELGKDKQPDILAYFVVSNFASLWNADLLFNDRKKLHELTDFLIATIKK